MNYTHKLILMFARIDQIIDTRVSDHVCWLYASLCLFVLVLEYPQIVYIQ